MRKLAVAVVVVAMGGCASDASDPSNIDEEAIAELQASYENRGFFWSNVIGLDGPSYGFRRIDPDLDREMIEQEARDQGLTREETDVLLERMRAEKAERDAEKDGDER